MTGQKLHMTGANFLQSIIPVLNILTKFDNASLFYKTLHILNQSSHSLFKFSWKDILSNVLNFNYVLKTTLWKIENN